MKKSWLNTPAVVEQIDRGLEENARVDRELDAEASRKALQAAFDEIVTRYLRKHVPTEPTR